MGFGLWASGFGLRALGFGLMDMINEHANPPRLAQRLLHLTLAPRDVETISGDLLEEYRDVRRPMRGQRRADVWYIGHVLSVVGRLIWPFALALIVARFVLIAINLFPLAGPWIPSLLPAPNVSLVDAVVFVAAGYYGARRTGRVATGLVSAGVLSLVDFAIFAAYATLAVPGLLTAITDKPFILVIGFTFLAIAMTFALTLGVLGATIGRWTTNRFTGVRST